MAKHLHWLVLVKNLFSLVYNFLIFFFIIYFTLLKQHKFFIVIFALIVVMSVIFECLSYWKTTFTIDSHELTYRKGIFFKDTTHIPYIKIQSIERMQPFYLRPFKLLQLKIETSGQSDDSIKLEIISVSVANQLETTRNHFHEKVVPIVLYPQNKINNTSIASNEHINFFYQITQHNLFLYGLTSISIIPTIIFIGLIGGKIYDYVPKYWLTSAHHLLITGSIILIIFLAIIAIIIGLIASFISTLNAYFHHRVTRVDNTFTIERGLLKTGTVHFDQRRIQAVTLEQRLLLRLFNLYTVKLSLATSSVDSEFNQGSLVFIPVIEKRLLKHILNQLLPEYNLDNFDFNLANQHHFGYFLRYALLRFIWLPVLLIPIYYGWWQISIFVLVIILISIVAWAWLANHDLGYTLTPRQLNIQNNNWYTKNIHLLQPEKIQATLSSQSIFMAQKKLKHLTFTTRKGITKYNITMCYLTDVDFQRLNKWYHDNVIIESR